MEYAYGPVPSRRLGRSLGVDLLPLKTCTYNCVYCQLGRTTCQTVLRSEYAPVEAILAELKSKLAVEPRPDYVSLAGSGEPTLHARIGDAPPPTARPACRSPVADREILGLLARRPCTAQGVAAGLDLGLLEATKRLSALTKTGEVSVLRKDDDLFYGLTSKPAEQGFTESRYPRSKYDISSRTECAHPRLPYLQQDRLFRCEAPPE
jgi:hypothetical protein